MINLQQQLRMGLKLTPQQVQYLKLLQLPTIAMEQRIKTELELNPMLEIDESMTQTLEQEEPEAVLEQVGEDGAEKKAEDSYTLDDYMNDDLEGYKSPERSFNTPDDEEAYEPLIPSTIPLSERLLSQFRLLDVDETDILLAEEIIGNVDEDGYLRRELALIVQDLNLSFGLSIGIEHAECVLKKIQQLDPPGIGARHLQECLIAQLTVGKFDPVLKELALRIVRDCFDDLKQKRFDTLTQHLQISTDTLKKVLDLIQHLNPKPGEGQFTPHENYITPDFIVRKDDDDFIILLNDRNIPPLRLNRAYKELATARNRKTDREAKDFIRKKFESAKWFIASIHQRRETLLKVMRAIIDRQRQWFEEGEVLKPMIYKDIAGAVGVDISTISRVVNNKYVQTEYGVFPLKYFFTAGLESENGENISNLMVKQHVKEIIDTEDPQKPLNDDQIAEILRSEGIKIARRTVAKYREMLGLPVARMRRKL